LLHDAQFAVLTLRAGSIAPDDGKESCSSTPYRGGTSTIRAKLRPSGRDRTQVGSQW
jgi:hypothetical protein